MSIHEIDVPRNSTHVHTVTRIVVLETVPHIVLLWPINMVSLPYKVNR